jgi:hypothetical protein
MQRGWWVKDGVPFDEPNGNHTQQFQIWFNEGEWRLGYTNHYWYVNEDPHDWEASKWIPQEIGGKYFPPDFNLLLKTDSAPSLRITPSSTSTETDFQEYVRFLVWHIWSFKFAYSLLIAAIFFCTLSFIIVTKRIYRRGKADAISNVPKGFVLTAEELAQHVKYTNSNVSIGKLIDGNDPTMVEKTGDLKQHELVISGEEKGCCVYVFDFNGYDETMLVVQVRHCVCGPPLLPKYEPDGSLRWEIAADQYVHFATYLAMAMERLTGEDWSHRILPHLHNTFLVRYQAVIKQEDFQFMWETMLKPFGEQRVCYRRFHKSSKAPDIYFGVEAKPCDPSDMPDDGTGDCKDENMSTTNTTSGYTTSGSAPTSESGRQKESTDGIILPKASVWLDFWQSADIPQNNTFVDFAETVNESGFLRRVHSSPDLAGREEESSDFGDDMIREVIRI